MVIIKDDDVVELAHGAGGKVMDSLIKNFVLESFVKRSISKSIPFLGEGVGLEALEDGGSFQVGDFEIVVSIDGHTVKPVFFPGGDLGRLAVSGTVNDVAVMGAEPLVLACSVIVEEGYPLKDLKRILDSANATTEEADIVILTGDTKVMPRRELDEIVFTTAGIGIVESGKIVRNSGLRAGDTIIISGTIGDHGVALLAAREGLEFTTSLVSDVAPLSGLIREIRNLGQITAMKDPTRGGVSSALNDLAQSSKASIWIREESLPFKKEVKAAAEMLGLDPLEVTCEGKIIIGCKAEKAEEILDTLKKNKYGKDAAIIGTVKPPISGKPLVVMETSVGGKRVVEKPIGEPIPRVC